MQAIKILVFPCLLMSIQPAFSQVITLAETTELMRDVNIPVTWRLAKSMKQQNRYYPNTYCAIFHSKLTKQWIGKLCLTTNKEYISDVGIRNEVPEEEDWADRTRYEVGYWRVTPLSLYPMTPFILKPIKNYAAESDCFMEDGPVYRATSMCHTTLYELRPGVFIFSDFHFFDNVKRKQITNLSDIKALWIQIGNRIKNKSSQ